MIYAVLADAVLVLHTGFVLYVVAGLILVALGGWRRWHWVKNRWFRLLHLLAIAIVTAQAWLGVWCPLTLVEIMLRQKAGTAAYRDGFISHWLDALLYIQAPAWVFTLGYTLFAAAVGAAWFWVRPLPFKHRR